MSWYFVKEILTTAILPTTQSARQAKVSGYRLANEIVLTDRQYNNHLIRLLHEVIAVLLDENDQG